MFTGNRNDKKAWRRYLERATPYELRNHPIGKAYLEEIYKKYPPNNDRQKIFLTPLSSLYNFFPDVSRELAEKNFLPSQEEFNAIYGSNANPLSESGTKEWERKMETENRERENLPEGEGNGNNNVLKKITDDLTFLRNAKNSSSNSNEDKEYIRNQINYLDSLHSYISGQNSSGNPLDDNVINEFNTNRENYNRYFPINNASPLTQTEEDPERLQRLIDSFNKKSINDVNEIMKYAKSPSYPGQNKNYMIETMTKDAEKSYAKRFKSIQDELVKAYGWDKHHEHTPTIHQLRLDYGKKEAENERKREEQNIINQYGSVENYRTSIRQERERQKEEQEKRANQELLERQASINPVNPLQAKIAELKRNYPRMPDNVVLLNAQQALQGEQETRAINNRANILNKQANEQIEQQYGHIPKEERARGGTNFLHTPEYRRAQEGLAYAMRNPVQFLTNSIENNNNNTNANTNYGEYVNYLPPTTARSAEREILEGRTETPVSNNPGELNPYLQHEQFMQQIEDMKKRYAQDVHNQYSQQFLSEANPIMEANRRLMQMHNQNYGAQQSEMGNIIPTYVREMINMQNNQDTRYVPVKKRIPLHQRVLKHFEPNAFSGEYQES